MMRTAVILFTVSAGLMIGTIGHAQSTVKRTYFKNGNLESTRYVAAGGLFFITYHENGKVREMGCYRNGLPDGAWKQFDASGTLMARVRFQDGRPIGVSDLYDPAKSTSGKLYYKEGVLQRAELRNAIGELVAARDY